MNERAAKASQAEAVQAASNKEVRSTVAAPSAGDVEPSTREAQIAAIAARPSWTDLPRLGCQAKDCNLEAVAYALPRRRARLLPAGGVLCSLHSAFFRRMCPDRRVVPLVDCSRCRRQGPLGGDFTREGDENPQRLCRGCADLIDAIIREPAPRIPA